MKVIKKKIKIIATSKRLDTRIYVITFPVIFANPFVHHLLVKS